MAPVRTQPTAAITSDTEEIFTEERVAVNLILQTLEENLEPANNYGHRSWAEESEGDDDSTTHISDTHQHDSNVPEPPIHMDVDDEVVFQNKDVHSDGRDVESDGCDKSDDREDAYEIVCESILARSQRSKNGHGTN